MNILVTGGAGFIGSNFVRYILEEHDEFKVLNLDKLTYAGNLENLKEVEANQNYEFVCGDICNADLVSLLLRQHSISAVINFAAESHVDRSIAGAAEFVQTNVQGTLNLLDRAKEHGIDRFLQVSTDEVYGSLGDTGAFTESSPLQPHNPYSASKASADLLVHSYHHTFGMPVLITRCSNNYGPYQFPEKLIPLMISNAMEGKPLPVYGDGKNVRDWIHTLDHSKAIEAVLLNGKPGETYNIGSENEWANIDLVHRILELVGASEDLITFVKDRPGHDRRYAIDASKAKAELGWGPQIGFEDGLAETVNWYKQNQEWWQNIKAGGYQDYYRRHYLKERGIKD
ncbi:MAG: dTDP-glucose 4,6-dehydratase [Planctomycetota bacterium]|nr:dTDP-glucose 4,6-dehydratase [Planctomycetota bacterium]MDA1141224.1 dTDP-glucose 4,6-dehydratase [Planctomycetota bacterium]